MLRTFGVSVLLLTCQTESPSAEILVRQAESAYHAQRYKESSSLYSRAVALLPADERAGTEYNMACAQALAGERSEALTTLEAAVQDGYVDRKDTETDRDLVSLHAESRWAVKSDTKLIVTYNSKEFPCVSGHALFFVSKSFAT